MNPIDYTNHPAHADHDPALGRDFRPRRNPVMAIFRRILSAQEDMEKAWTTLRRDITDQENLRAYVRKLRRAERLSAALNPFLPSA